MCSLPSCQLGGSFLFLCAFVAFCRGSGSRCLRAGALAAKQSLRLYLLACVVCWAIVIWISIVVMRVLGNLLPSATGNSRLEPRTAALGRGVEALIGHTVIHRPTEVSDLRRNAAIHSLSSSSRVLPVSSWKISFL